MKLDAIHRDLADYFENHPERKEWTSTSRLYHKWLGCAQGWRHKGPGSYRQMKSALMDLRDRGVIERRVRVANPNLRAAIEWRLDPWG